MVDGVFQADGAGGVRFHEARGIGPDTIAEIQAQVRHRLLSVLARRSLLESEESEAMPVQPRLWGDRNASQSRHRRFGAANDG